MAIKGYFLDNESYSADDVNKAFSYLTTQGVSLFSDTGAAIDDIDAALSSITTEGVDIYNKESCLVCKSDDVYMVKKGVCFLPDGAFVCIDDDGIILDVTDGAVNYVYAKHDKLKNECTVYVSDTEGTDGAVALAEIDENGKITDKRVFATAKIAVPTANITATKTITITFPTGRTKGAYTYNEEIFDVGFGGFNYIRSEFQGDTYYSYIGDGEKVFFVDGLSAAAWVQKSGSSLIVTTGTWGLTGAQIKNVEMFLF